MTIFDSPEWQELSQQLCEAADNYQKQADELYNALPHDDRLKVFCAVCNLIYKGDIKEKRTYRGVLYDVCGFDPGSYMVAQHAGYMAIHNAIYDGEELRNTIKDFVTNHLNVAEDDLEKQLDDFFIKKYV